MFWRGNGFQGILLTYLAALRPSVYQTFALRCGYLVGLSRRGYEKGHGERVFETNSNIIKTLRPHAISVFAISGNRPKNDLTIPGIPNIWIARNDLMIWHVRWVTGAFTSEASPILWCMFPESIDPSNHLRPMNSQPAKWEHVIWIEGSFQHNWMV